MRGEDAHPKTKPPHFQTGDLSPENRLLPFLDKIMQGNSIPVYEISLGINESVINTHGNVVGRNLP
jgi:hypothetical protein